MGDPPGLPGRETAERGLSNRLNGAHIIEVFFEDQLAENRSPRYIDNRVVAVGTGLTVPGTLVFAGTGAPVFVPEQLLDWGTTTAKAEESKLFSYREDANAAIAGRPGAWYAYFKTAGGMTAPTKFSWASAPRIMRASLEGRRQLSEEGLEIFTALAFSLVAGVVIRLGFRVLRKLDAWGQGTPTPRQGSSSPSKELPPNAPGAPKGGGPEVMSRGTTGRQTGSRTTAPDTNPQPANTRRLLPLPGESPEEYYFRSTGQHLHDLPPPVRASYARQAAQDMAYARIEAALDDPNAVWTHYLTKGGYPNIMRTERLRAGAGTAIMGGGEQVRAVPGPFQEGAPRRTGNVYLDFEVRDRTVPGVARHFIQGEGASWRTAGGLKIKVLRVGYPDGSYATRLTSGNWRLQTPAGRIYDLDSERLIQLGETPSQGLKALSGK